MTVPLDPQLFYGLIETLKAGVNSVEPQVHAIKTSGELDPTSDRAQDDREHTSAKEPLRPNGDRVFRGSIIPTRITLRCPVRLVIRRRFQDLPRPGSYVTELLNQTSIWPSPDQASGE